MNFCPAHGDIAILALRERLIVDEGKTFCTSAGDAFELQGDGYDLGRVRGRTLIELRVDGFGEERITSLGNGCGDGELGRGDFDGRQSGEGIGGAFGWGGGLQGIRLLGAESCHGAPEKEQPGGDEAQVPAETGIE